VFTITADLPEGSKTFKLSTAENSASRQLNDAIYCFEGADVSGDYSEAAKYYADEVDGDGKLHYGFCLLDGKTVKMPTKRLNILDDRRIVAKVNLNSDFHLSLVGNGNT
jgi:TPR repeat protein